MVYKYDDSAMKDKYGRIIYLGEAASPAIQWRISKRNDSSIVRTQLQDNTDDSTKENKEHDNNDSDDAPDDKGYKTDKIDDKIGSINFFYQPLVYRYWFTRKLFCQRYGYVEFEEEYNLLQPDFEKRMNDNNNDFIVKAFCTLQMLLGKKPNVSNGSKVEQWLEWYKQVKPALLPDASDIDKAAVNFHDDVELLNDDILQTMKNELLLCRASMIEINCKAHFNVMKADDKLFNIYHDCQLLKNWLKWCLDGGLIEQDLINWTEKKHLIDLISLKQDYGDQIITKILVEDNWDLLIKYALIDHDNLRRYFKQAFLPFDGIKKLQECHHVKLAELIQLRDYLLCVYLFKYVVNVLINDATQTQHVTWTEYFSDFDETFGLTDEERSDKNIYEIINKWNKMKTLKQKWYLYFEYNLYYHIRMFTDASNDAPNAPTDIL